MRKIFLYVALLSAATTSAQSKISLPGIDRLEQIKSYPTSRADGDIPTIEAIVTMTDGWTEEGFDKTGAKIVETITDNIIIVEVPADKIEAFAGLEDVFYVEFGQEYKPMLDYGRPGSKVTEIQNGFEHDGTTVSFDGTGVVTGLMDEGIDPNHINFTDANGTTRVKQAYDYTNNISAVNSSSLRRFTTDNATATHGTHVAGIMTGGYKGDGTYCTVASPTGRTMQKVNGNIPYYGVATNSDIVMTGGTLTDANILKGVKAIVAYGQSVGKPVVVNLSLGANYGPHDGSGSLESGINALGENAIICIASGNEGDSDMFVGKEFTENDTELNTFIAGNNFSGMDIWTNGPEPVTVTISLFDTARRRLTDIATVDATKQSASSRDNDKFAEYMSGSFTMRAGVNRLNNRYQVYVSGSFTQKVAGQNVALSIKGSAGQRIYVYGFGNSSTSFAQNGVSGYTGGTTDGTISNLACGNRSIAVGSYNTRTTWPTFSGVYAYNGSYVVDKVSPFTSYGETYQGVRLPVICAPGANIISSLNRYYTNTLTGSKLEGQTSAQAAGSMTNYWGPMQGTSMACPYVSGVAALMLQADATLTVDDVISIFKKTAIAPDSSLPEAQKLQWGGGRLDALAAIKEVLNRKSAGIEGIVADNDANVFWHTDGNGIFELSLPGATDFTATLYSLQGIATASTRGHEGNATLDASSAAAGVYILTVKTPNCAPVSRKVAIR